MDKLTLIRHAETEWSLQGKHTGLTDIPLTSHGEAQAKALKEILQKQHFDHIFVSPLKRALDTTRLCGLSDRALIDPDLVEWNYGKYEGLTSQQIHEQDPNWNIFANGGPGGETVVAAWERAKRVLKKMDTLKGKIILFSSGHFCRLMAACWLHQDPTFGNLIALDPASLSELGRDKGQPILIRWNQIIKF